MHCFVARSDSTAKFSIRGEAHEFIYGRALVAAEYPAKKDAAYNVKQFSCPGQKFSSGVPARTEPR